MPVPVAAYDPSRRIFIGGLSPQTTTKDIIAAVKSKTKAQPTHVEIALAKKLNSNQKERDINAPAPAITRRRKPKIKIPGCSSSSDDDEILQMNFKNRVVANNNNEDAAEKNKNNSNNNNDDSDNDDGDDNNNNKKKNNNNSNNNQQKEKKPLRDCRGFAHVTVEGLKSVMEQLHGVVVNDKPIRVAQARPHYLWKLDKVKKDVEKEQEKKKAEIEAITSKEGYGELDYTKPPIRSTTAAKKKFGNIGSQIAAKLRQKAKERKQRAMQFANNGHQNDRFSGARRQREDESRSGKPFNSADNKNNNKKKFGKKDGKDSSTDSKKKAADAPPPPPPEPTKTDRKLSALEARLAALQAKLKKK